MHSECQLQPELNVAWPIRQAWFRERVLMTLAYSAGLFVPNEVVNHGSVRVVECVQELSVDIEFDAFGDRNRFADRDIRIHKPGSDSGSVARFRPWSGPVSQERTPRARYGR
jgi:hypothetical protein